MTQHLSVYERVTETILAELEKGVAPWVKPWVAGAHPTLPYNAISQRRYSGVNVFLLWESALVAGYRHPAWITFRQTHSLGGHVKKGEHATYIVYASTYTKQVRDPVNGDETEERIPFLKFYAVFNIEQTAGLAARLYFVPDPKPVAEAILEVESFLTRIGADVRHGGNCAYYRPALDAIQLPEPEYFESTAHYYATSLHEHAHWTGHETRLKRDLKGRFGEEAYAAEELVAEFAAAYLCAVLAIPGKLRHAEYIGSWAALLRKDKKAIFTAAARATEAARYLEALGSPAGAREVEDGADGEE